VSLARYAMWVAASVGGPFVLLALAAGASDPLAVRSAAFGAGLAGVNAVLAYGLAIWSQNRSTNVFLGAVLGGMVARMGLLLAAVAVGLGMLGLSRVPLVTSLLGYFVVFLVLELKALNRRPLLPAPPVEGTR
jgi:hypothetical protein